MKHDEHDVQFALHQNHPNPFVSTTRISFSIPDGGHVKLSLYDVMGRRIGMLIDNRMSAGSHEIDWPAGDERGANLSPGVYLFRLEFQDYVETGKMLFAGRR